MTTHFKPGYLEQRRNPQRPIVNITMRLPEEVIDDLKQIAPRVGFRGYQALIRAYIGPGLARHVTEINQRSDPAVAAALQRCGWNEQQLRHFERAFNEHQAEFVIKHRVRLVLQYGLLFLIDVA